MARRRGAYFKDRRLALVGGVAGLAFAAFCFRDAYERRGRQRPGLVSYLGV